MSTWPRSYPSSFRRPLAIGAALTMLLWNGAGPRADGTAQPLPFSQDWTNAGLMTTDDDWSGVPGIIGYRGDDLTTVTGTNPQTIVADGTATPVDVNANQANPSTFATGGVAEFDGIANHTIAVQGSGTADAPFILINIDTTGLSSVTVGYNLRDLDGSADNAVQPVALQYRLGSSGNFTNLPAGFVADATTGPSLATLVTPVSVTLPANADNQPLVQLRVMTTNAVGNDEWVGIDDITITGLSSSSPTGTGAATPSTVQPGDPALLTISVTPGQGPPSTGIAVVSDLSSIGGSASQSFFDDGTNGDVAAGNNVFSFQATVSASTSFGVKSLPASITDAQLRSASTAITLGVGDTTSPVITVPPGVTAMATGTLTTVTFSASANDNVDGPLTPTCVPASGSGFPVGNTTVNCTATDAGNNTGNANFIVSVVLAPGLPFSQDWSNSGLITANNDWSGVTGIVGYRGDGLTSAPGTNPQTTLADGTSTPINVIANQSSPNTSTAGGIAEFDGIADRAVALQGSGTADAPFLLISVNTLGESNIAVSYKVRDIDGSADNAAQQVALQYRVGNNGAFTNLPGGLVADGTDGPNLATKVTPVQVLLPANVDDQALVQIRIITNDAPGSDEWVGIDDILIENFVATTNPSAAGSATPSTASIGDPVLLTVSVTPGLNPPSTGITVSADLTAIGGAAVQPLFDDGTNGDVTPDDKVFSLRTVIAPGTSNGIVSLPVSVADAQGRLASASTTISLTIQAPPSITQIHDIQGPGSLSPFDGQIVTTTGIVTAVKSNGFYIQEPDNAVDTDPNTSEGLFIFTSGAPSAGVVLGNLVRVAGTVTEFIPAADPGSPPTTEIGFATVTPLSSGQALPVPQLVTPADINTTTGPEPLERFEGMRVHIDTVVAIAPTGGFITESTATSTSNGVFHAVMPGVPRPFREPGLNAGNPAPAEAVSPATIPRFDTNPERLRVETSTLGGSPLDVTTGATVTNLVGVVDFRFRAYTILTEAATPPAATPNMSAAPVRVATADEFTVGSFNMERFFDTTDDGSVDDVVLTPAAFALRLNKASLAIRDVLRTPDIIGVEEVENLTTLLAIAAKVNSDATAAGQIGVNYDAFLSEGNDIGGIDVGFLVNLARVEVIDVTQFGKNTMYTPPGSTTPALLNDRPSLLLRSIIHAPGRPPYPLTVIVNHLRSLSGVDDPVDGFRVRTKRRLQAEALANLIQSRQAANPAEHIVSVGDYNAFQFNDGFGDSIGTIRGTPTPANQVAQASPDLVNPDLTNLVDGAQAIQRYSFMFDGNAQELDHVLATSGAQNKLVVTGLQWGRMDGDFPEIYRADANRPERVSDHDPLVAFFAVDQAPVCSAASPVLSAPIFPVDHAMRSVTIGNVTDADGDPVAITIGAICQDEPPNAEGVPAWATDGAVNASSASVRAERSGTRVNPGNGRMYHVFFRADDGRGSCGGEVKVGVPLIAGGPVVDDGPLYDSLTGGSRIVSAGH